ncbi:hypothetical protein ABD76_23395 [Paenibacillus dendritiformis]|nr:hypothetical protein [Paenibacillus dendritiformis]
MRLLDMQQLVTAGGFACMFRLLSSYNHRYRYLEILLEREGGIKKAKRRGMPPPFLTNKW